MMHFLFLIMYSPFFYSLQFIAIVLKPSKCMKWIKKSFLRIEIFLEKDLKYKRNNFGFVKKKKTFSWYQLL